MFARTWWLD